MHLISKEFAFSAGHVLEGLPESHPCGRLHGHNYVVVLVLASDTLNEVGFVVDFNDLNLFKKWIDDHVDHRHLNDVCEFNPTAENLAKWFFEIAYRWWPEELFQVKVSETPKTWAIYSQPIQEKVLNVIFTDAREGNS